MKFANIFISSLMILFLFSCSDDDNNNRNVDDSLLLGTWQIQDFQYSGTTTYSLEGEVVVQNFVAEVIDLVGTTTFEFDPNIYTSTGSYTVDLTSELEGEVFTQRETLDDFLGGGIWSLSGSTLTISAEDITIEYNILELTENTLVFDGTYEYSLVLQGIDVESTVDFYYEYSR